MYSISFSAGGDPGGKWQTEKKYKSRYENALADGVTFVLASRVRDGFEVFARTA
jgi:hypothetical protein